MVSGHQELAQSSVVDVVLWSVNVDTDPSTEGSCQVSGWSSSRPPSGRSARLPDCGGGQGALHGATDLRLQTGDDPSDEVRLIHRGAAGGGGGAAEPTRGGSGKS